MRGQPQGGGRSLQGKDVGPGGGEKQTLEDQAGPDLARSPQPGIYPSVSHPSTHSTNTVMMSQILY